MSWHVHWLVGGRVGWIYYVGLGFGWIGQVWWVDWCVGWIGQVGWVG